MCFNRQLSPGIPDPTKPGWAFVVTSLCLCKRTKPTLKKKVPLDSFMIAPL